MFCLSQGDDLLKPGDQHALCTQLPLFLLGERSQEMPGTESHLQSVSYTNRINSEPHRAPTPQSKPQALCTSQLHTPDRDSELSRHSPSLLRDFRPYNISSEQPPLSFQGQRKQLTDCPHFPSNTSLNNTGHQGWRGTCSPAQRASSPGLLCMPDPFNPALPKHCWA